MRIRALQSGTSADGIDHVTASFTPHGDVLHVRIEDHGTAPMPADLGGPLARALGGDALTGEEWNRLDTRLGQAFGDVAARPSSAGAVDLVVSHGQTVHHGVSGDAVWGTLQLGQPAWIARATGAPVLFGVRVADVAAGGMGAPLMTAFDELWLARGVDEPAAVVATLNLGGIANVQVRGADGAMTGFDTGPANALLDAWTSSAVGEPCDRDGVRSARGRVDTVLLERLRRHPYFALPAPKTTGRETFDLGVVRDALNGREIAVDDVCATLVELTAGTVADALRDAGVTGATGSRVIASGGGTRNLHLMRRLRALLAPLPVETSDDHGIASSARESLMFATLGWFALTRTPLRLPGTPSAAAAVAGQWDLSLAPLPVLDASPTPPRRIVVDAAPGRGAAPGQEGDSR